MTVPLVFTLEEMLPHFVDPDRRCDPTAEEVEIAGVRLGRNAYPGLVISLYNEGLLNSDVAATVVPSAWSAAEFPSLQLEQEEWRDLFDLAGYTVDGKRAARPGASLSLWRGAIPEHRLGWAWTDDREVAEWFAARPHNSGRGRVFTAEVEPSRLLARISEQRPGESEYVVDARGLETVADCLRTERTTDGGDLHVQR
ncbi:MULTISPECIES: hypothetical protein [unclassified Nocardioides]|uniref:hypothetical protein n=1 Tax=unclassified Nocardioides TaxID=2615069 RepID=UPI0011238E9A|nr:MULTISPECIES: hypothetical protein [unclassified Nocardioides]